ncbi:MAG: class I tRNA ligase family protein, partial [Cryomorphaceae bacterium]|nr:class I tRNA ligase family protein [Cryomorphaceae bacterium]MBT4293836.1 class I tRNA ligase family protein [Cryomorphaceae bacterium]
VTRDLDWGIPVQVDGDDGKVLYVWFEAPIGYISSTKEWAQNNNKDWEHYWKNPKTNLIHFIGKDNIVFHCIIFPIMLKMFGDFILPKNVPANEFLNLEGDKISTSKNWAVWLHEYLIEFPNMQDVLRYVLTATCPETKDNDFTWKEFQTRNNSELVAIYGNFTNRVLSLIDKYYEGKIPNPKIVNDSDNETLKEVVSLKNDMESNLNEFKFREALRNLIGIARLGNKHLADNEPWKIKNENPERVEQILKTSFEIVTYLAVLSEPFLPFTSEKLKKMIGLNKTGWSNLDNLGSEIDFNFTITNKEMLFRRIEGSEIEFQIDKLKKGL